MASGFILANQRGIAVSMDTMEASANGEEYRGINRLFPLGGQHKVVAVSTGMDKFMNIPVELLIQQFANSLGTQPLDQLVDYSTSFVEFLNSKQSGLGEDWYLRDNVRLILGNLFNYFMQLQRANREEQPFEVVINQAVEKVCQRWQLGQQNRQISELDRQHFIEQYQGPIATIINNWVKESASYGKNTNGGIFAKQLLMPSQESAQGQRSVFSSIYPRLFEAIRNVLTTDIRQNYASIYLVGFGGREAFGSCQFINLYGFLGELLAKNGPVDQINQDHNQLIKAVSTYTRQSVGAELLQQGMAEVSFQQIERIIADNGMQLADQQRVLNTVRQAMDNHTAGIRQTIVNLSPAELAQMSRTMVEANSFVSRYSFRNAGVGGDIETVTITFQDGPVWVYRQGASKKREE
ncbi:hypothetical protein [uncultured Limosilactobacillus sp.]|uniref:hypothetical protein n=1 Tax=uncultured Limosilactobacillus sp. TaxID=2837629 RepID=UPI0025EC158E|nr:hypothetical protein [uncultured Limosilactobacillus sp.]